MEGNVRRAPREVKIRRAIVVLSSWQTALGAVIIAMSFTVFACSSSERIRNACPYWAGFTVLFTGSVGFLTWKQLSIISIGIYTFLSAVSVIVHLVGTVLTGDSAGFLRSLHVCVEIKFEHACGCCVMNESCKLPYKFPSVRDCSILNGLLKDLMYGLCALNVICCLICLGITVMGCTLVVQYSQYSQTFRLRWHRHPGEPAHDHRYNWLAFPSDPSNYIPPCAPPIYYPVQNNPADPESRNRRPPTVFDPVDFPPPYSSREPSLSGRQQTYGLGVEYSLVSSGQGSSVEGVELVTGYQDYEARGQESGDVFDRDQGDSRSSSGCIAQYDSSGEGDGSTSRDGSGHEERSCGTPGDMGELSSPKDNDGRIDLYHQAKTCFQETETQTHDFVFESMSSAGSGTQREESGSSQGITIFTEQPRRHSCPHNRRLTQSDEVYCPHHEVYQGIIAHNVNPWSRTLSYPNNSPSPHQPKRRANSIPRCSTAADRVLMIHKGCQTSNVTDGETSVNSLPGPTMVDAPSGKRSAGAEDLGDLFRNFKESNVTKSRKQRRRRRPRNNPGHILERETGKNCRETTL